MAAAGIGVGVVLLLWWVSSGPSAPAAAPSNNLGAAASIGAAQIAADQAVKQSSIAADAATSQAQIAASVANLANNNQLAALIAANNSATAQANAAAGALIAGSNASVAQAQIAANAAVTENYNNATLSEFQTLAQTILSYGQNAQNQAAGVTNNLISAQSGDYRAAVAKAQGQVVVLPFGGGGSISYAPVLPNAPNYGVGSPSSGVAPSSFESSAILSQFTALSNKVGPVQAGIPQTTDSFAGQHS